MSSQSNPQTHHLSYCGAASPLRVEQENESLWWVLPRSTEKFQNSNGKTRIPALLRLEERLHNICGRILQLMRRGMSLGSERCDESRG